MPIGQALRQRLLEKAAESQAKKDLIKRLGPRIEQLLTVNPKPKSAYVHGSYPTKKPEATDIDILAKFDNYKDAYINKSRADKELGNLIPARIDYKTYVPSEDKEMLRSAVKEGKDRYGKDYKWLKILGLGGATTAGALYASEDDAMAGPMTDASKALLKKAITAVESSAAKPLIGTKYKDKVIKRITKGEGDWRYIVFGDDEVEAVNKSVINNLARKEGTDQAITKFNTGTAESKLAQAYKSLEIRKVNAADDQRAVIDYFKQYRNQVKGTNNVVPKTALVEVEGKYFSMPKEYADLLNSEGALKIIKEMK